MQNIDDDLIAHPERTGARTLPGHRGFPFTQRIARSADPKRAVRRRVRPRQRIPSALPKEYERALIRSYQARGDLVAMHTVILANLDLVSRRARHFRDPEITADL